MASCVPSMGVTLGLESAIMIVALPPTSMDPGIAVIVAIGACSKGAFATVRSAVASAPANALATVTGPVWLVMRLPVPAAVPLTLSTILQLTGYWSVAGGIVPPIRAADVPPASAVTVPPHVLMAMTPPGALAAFTKPSGYASVNCTPVSAVVFEFVSSMVICVVPPTYTYDGSNHLATVGGGSLIRTVA